MIDMKQEDKELLLKDLCARLPYGVVINVEDKDLKLDRQHQEIGILYPEDCSEAFNKRYNQEFYITISGCYYGENIKPYLRPMASMTKEEEKTYNNLCYKEERKELEFGEWVTKIYYHDTIASIDYLNSIHIDYRGLILMNLALEAPKNMYNISK